MEQKRCKNKKCQRILPEGYKHKYCENCRNEYAKQIKEGCKGALGLALTVGLAVITKGKIDIKTSLKNKIKQYHKTVYKMFRHKISMTIL